MNLCSLQHEPVAYSGWTCPVCDALYKVETLEDKVKDLEQEINDLKVQVDNASNRN